MNLDSKPFAGLLNSSTAGLGCPGLISVALISNSTIEISSLVLYYFSLFFWQTLCILKNNFTCFITLSVLKLPTHFITRNLLWKSTIWKQCFLFIEKSQLQQISIVSLLSLFWCYYTMFLLQLNSYLKYYWPQCCIVRYFILWRPHSVLHFQQACSGISTQCICYQVQLFLLFVGSHGLIVFFNRCLCLLYKSCYVLFYVHLLFIYAKFHSGAHTFAGDVLEFA